MTPKTYIVFSRLEPEKGIDLLIQSLISLDQEGFWKKNRCIICGKGSLQGSLLEALRDHGIVDLSHSASWTKKLSTTGLSYLGWKNLDQLGPILSECDIHLMPSTFLETFGLSALEMATRHIPTIALYRGGVREFLIPELIIPEGENLSKNISETIKKVSGFSEEILQELKNHAFDLAQKYTEAAFLQKFKTSFPKADSILFIADYLTIIGGLERTTEMFRETLADAGMEVSAFGSECPVVGSESFRRRMLIFSPWNWLGAKRIREIIQEKKPDLVWIQGMYRVWSYLGVRAVLKSRVPTVIMHHDFGIIAPFATDIRSLDLLPKKWSLFSFLKSSQKKGIFVTLFLLYKFILLSLYHRQIRKIHTHFVPSSFMVEAFSRLLSLPPERFEVVPLYVGDKDVK